MLQHHRYPPLLSYSIHALACPLAQCLGDITSQYRWFTVAYLLHMFSMAPAISFGLSLAVSVTMYVVLTSVAALRIHTVVMLCFLKICALADLFSFSVLFIISYGIHPKSAIVHRLYIYAYSQSQSCAKKIVTAQLNLNWSWSLT